MFLLPRCGNSARITREREVKRERRRERGERGVLKINFAWNLIYVHDDDFLA